MMITSTLSPKSYSTVISELFNRLKDEKLEPEIRLDIAEALRELGTKDKSEIGGQEMPTKSKNVNEKG